VCLAERRAEFENKEKMNNRQKDLNNEISKTNYKRIKIQITFGEYVSVKQI
jgi:hypothetical protein